MSGHEKSGYAGGRSSAEEYDVTVIGGGPAGLAAAEAAADAKARVLVIEREERAGGILKQCIHDGFGVLRYGERLTGPEYALRDLEAVRRAGVDLSCRTFVHELCRRERGWTLTVVDGQRGLRQIASPALVMATGCRERSDRQIFLQGERPAGIFTAGQAQRLININGVLPGRRVVILGSGDIGMIMARRFTLEGAEVLGVWEIRGEASGLPRNVAQCLEDFDIPLLLNMTVTAVHGRERVEAVTVVPVDERGAPIEERAERIECDTLVLSVGLIPEIDLLLERGRDKPAPAEAGAELDPRTGGLCVNQFRETGLPGLFLCGNALQVYDLVDYVSQCGAIAGRRAAAYALGRLSGRQGGQGLHGRQGAASLGIPLEAQKGAAVVVPQFLLPEGEGESPVLSFRVSRSAERARAELRAGERLVRHRPLAPARPQEMERLVLPRECWDSICAAPPPQLSMLVEEEERDAVD
jgi:thioredoxin reductase